MADREKVINALERCESYGYCENTGCPYYENVSCLELLRKDDLALLKEQEPIAPSICGSKEPDGHGCWWYLCGKCKKPIDHKDRFCKRCGQAVKWE